MGGIGDFNVEGWRKKRDGRRIAPEVRQVYSKGGIQDVKPQRGDRWDSGRLEGEGWVIV